MEVRLLMTVVVGAAMSEYRQQKSWKWIFRELEHFWIKAPINSSNIKIIAVVNQMTRYKFNVESKNSFENETVSASCDKQTLAKFS